MINQLDQIFRKEIFQNGDYQKIEIPYTPPRISWNGRLLGIATLSVRALALIISSLISFLFHQERKEKETSKSALNDTSNLIKRVISNKFTFNHISYFKLYKGVIWHKRIGIDGPWEEVPLSLNTGVHLVCIKSDGANLIARDNIGLIHYKKVIKEKREGLFGPYRFSVKVLKENWKAEWFTLPYLSRILNIVRGGKLKIDPSHAIALSHRGEFSSCSTNPVSKNYVRLPNATTLFEYDSLRHCIKLYDPWIPFFVDVTIPLPQGKGYNFEFLAMDASASLLALLGYIIKPSLEGESKLLSLLTLHVDVDMLGLNPMIPYNGGEKMEKNGDWHLSSPGWNNEPLPENAEKLFPGIKVVQHGPLQTSRTLILEGVDLKGRNGCFLREIMESSWRFIPLDVSSKVSIARYIESKDVSLESPSSDYHGALSLEEEWIFSLQDFAKEGMFSKLHIQKGGESITLKITLLPHFLTLIGMKQRRYVAYSNTGEECSLYPTLFGSKKVIPINIQVIDDEQLFIYIGNFSLFCRKSI